VRFDELVLLIPGDEFHIRFHPQLTVLSGIGMLERQALADSLIGALTGTAESTVLTMTDNSGREIHARASGGRVALTYVDDGSTVSSPVGTLAPDSDGLRTLMLVQAGDLGLTATRGRIDDPPDLAEARITLAALTKDLQASLSGMQALETAREELHRVEAQIRQAADGTAQREYARVLADLERVRAEAAALQSGHTGAEGDRHLLAAAAEARALASRWTTAARRLAELTDRLGSEPRLDSATASQLKAIPDAPPSDFTALVRAFDVARHEREDLDARLRGLAAARLPDPSDPRVVDLATIEQRNLWSARERVIDTEQRLHEEQVAMGGLEATGGQATEVVARLEAAHTEVEAAEAVVRRRFLPTVGGGGFAAVLALLATSAAPMLALPAALGAVVCVVIGVGTPQLRLRKARRAEDQVLLEAGAPTYLSFHMRRVDAAIDPHARNRLDVVAQEHREAIALWDELARGIDIGTAGLLEAETRRYATALAGVGGAADEIESLRTALVGRADPALAEARRALIDVCVPFGVDPSSLASADGASIERLLTRQVALGRRARAQDDVEEAEAEEEKLGARLDDLLHQLGFRDGELDARIGALEWAVGRATERQEARARARPRVDIEEDLERLQAEARRLRRPEWASVSPSDAAEPDVEKLRARRDELHGLITAGPGTAIDLDRLADRHSAMERRVAALESKLGSDNTEAAVNQLADVQQYLLAHLTQAGHLGPNDESVPVLLDEPFLRVAAERKWELLDMLRRLGEKTQLVYLTDDPFVTAWARRRAAAGLISLLEPVGENA
jgi:hypothetical protein